MKISIIIPSQNRFLYLSNLLDDLNMQTLKPYEVIIIDQSETPYTLDHKNNINHIVDQGKGPCCARNIGLKYATGEIIVFLDDDIQIRPDFLYQLCSPIIDEKSLVVVGAICDADGNYPNNEYPYWGKNYTNWLLSITANLDYPGSHNSLGFPTGCAAIHRSVYESVGQFDPFFDPDGVGEDRDYGLRIFHAGYNIMYNGSAAVQHLAAKTGGRRSIKKMGNKYYGFSHIEVNTLYIISKFFGWNIFKNQLRYMKFDLINQLFTVHPISFLKAIRRLINFARLEKQMVELKMKMKNS